MLIRARCHCGNVGLALDWPGEPASIPARACGCTFCQKHGGVWTSHPEAKLTVTFADPAQVSEYAFGTHTATFHVCARCGVVPVVTCTIDGKLRAVVNVNAFENVDRARLEHAPVSFEGEDVGSRLDRRQRNWIRDVTIARG